jgi:predicted alpha/beta hydrolase family esterase
MAARQGVEHWGGHVEDWRASGQSQIAYCKQHDLNIKSFRRWRTKLQPAAATAPSLTLVPISVGAPAATPAIRLHSPGGWRIELATANPAWLADLVRQLP